MVHQDTQDDSPSSGQTVKVGRRLPPGRTVQKELVGSRSPFQGLERETLLLAKVDCVTLLRKAECEAPSPDTGNCDRCASEC